jgi:hypothetical protein
MKCGGSVPAAASFCPGCGTAVADGGTAAGSTDDYAKRRRTRRLLGIFGGVIILGLIAAAALFVARRQPPLQQQTAIVPVGTPLEKAPGENSTKPTSQAVAGFDWSGLTAEQLLAARAALDEAIAKEEQSTAKGALIH